MDELFQIPATISKIEKMAKWWRLIVDTQEIPDINERVLQLAPLTDKIGWFTYSVRQIESEDIIDLPPLKKHDEEQKSPAQRMRDVLYRLFEQDAEGYGTFEDYYRAKMEKFVTHLKAKLA